MSKNRYFIHDVLIILGGLAIFLLAHEYLYEKKEIPCKMNVDGIRILKRKGLTLLTTHLIPFVY